MWFVYVILWEVLISSALSPLLGCRGQWRTTKGFIPSPLVPTSNASLTIVHKHRSSIKWNCGARELDGRGAEKEVVWFPCEEESSGRKAE